MNTDQPSNNPAPDWRELRRQEREQRRAERRAWRGDNAWVVGAILILLGIILMAQNFGALTLHNWWALFIMIPAIGSFAAAWNIFTRSGGQFTSGVIGPLIGGLILTGITATFLFDLNWGLVGPIILILLGVGALFGALFWRG